MEYNGFGTDRHLFFVILYRIARRTLGLLNPLIVLQAKSLRTKGILLSVRMNQKLQ